MNYSVPDFHSKSANQKVRKMLGRAYLREGRFSDALDVYLGILTEDPQDVEVLVVLGNLYRLAGCLDAAEQLYLQALDIRPENGLAGRLLVTVQDEIEQEGGCWSADQDSPLNSEAVSCLADRLYQLDRPAQIHAVRTAADLASIAHSTAPSMEKLVVDERFEELSSQPPEDLQLMPALIELNIRQARAAGHLDLAETLQSLHISLTRQVDDLGTRPTE